MQEQINKALEKSQEDFTRSLGNESDSTMIILKGHLYTENGFERIILNMLPRGDKVIENGSLTYHQKLVLISGFDCLPDSIISALRNLNKLRNQLAHDLGKSISQQDIIKIGSPLGKKFTELKKESEFNNDLLLKKIVHYLCGYIDGFGLVNEHTD